MVKQRLETFALLAFALLIVGGALLLLTRQPVPVTISIQPPPPTALPPPTNTPGPVQVYITGAVAKPNAVYVLAPGSRVADAVTAAGGLLPEADTSRVNLAALLHDGDQVHVQSVAGGKAAAGPTLATPGGPVHINSATLDDLQRLPGVGPVLAQRIIDYRTQNGPFVTLDDLDKVSGVGNARIEQWKELIAFD